MAIDPLVTWRSTLAALPSTSTPIWAVNFSQWYADRIVNIETDPSFLVDPGFSFVFSISTFKSALEVLPPTTDQLAGITAFATAWESAILASTVSAFPGAFIPPSTPATLFSIVSTTVIDPAGIAAGKAKIIELATALPVSDPLLSEFPVKFREATLLLTVTVTGFDSTPPVPGPGPLPLTAPLVPLI